MQKGTIAAASAYVLWGLLPLFWHALYTVPALEILAHRMVWSLLVVLALLAVRRDWRWLGEVWHDRRVVVTFGASALLLTLNWWVYIWAVNAGHVIETSLGYFINPLVNVLLGVLVLHEHLRGTQRIAITLALAGVLYLTISYGQVPWIALSLASTFGLYGLIRKQAPLGSLEGLTLETLLLFLPALAYLLVLEAQGRGAFGHQGVLTTLLLASAGIATATPLLLFAAGARQITLVSLGLLQYLAPTLQLLLGVLVFHEPLSGTRLAGFSLIWLALAIYTADGVLGGERRTRLNAALRKS